MVSPPPPVAAALEALDARRAELVDAQVQHRQAQREIAAARQRDTAAIAAALDAGEKRPARQHEAKAEKRAQEAALELEVAVERVRTAGARLHEALDADCESWVASVEEAWAGADERTLAAVEALRAVLLERNGLLVARGYVRSLAGASTRDMALASPVPTAGAGTISTLLGPNGEPMSAEEVLSGFEAHVAQTRVERILAGEREEREEREHQAQVQAERDEQTRVRQERETAEAEARDLRAPARR